MPKVRHTCTECSIRRQKCDRQIPCGRCRKRGVAHKCSRTWPQRTQDEADTGYRVSSPQVRQSAADHASPLTDQRPRENAAIDLEFLALGRDRTATLDRGISHQDAGDLDRRSMWGKGLSAQFQDGPISLLQLQLPSLSKIWHLVNYHERCLLWYHGCYHGPTFRRQLEDAATNHDKDALVIQNLNLQWLALLFSIMAGSLACATDRTFTSWAFAKTEVPKLRHQWYKATITCLNLAEYTSNHEIFSVHAITTLSMSAHLLGFSGELAVLLGAALKIAQALGLDRLAYEPSIDNTTEDLTAAQRQIVLRREIARRLWSQLCIQDWLSLPFSESHCINPQHFTSTKPSNRDHITMNFLPESFPTYISYGNYLYEISKLIAEHHSAVLQCSTSFNKYEEVLEFDARMRKLATNDMPRYFHVTQPIDPSWPEFIPWARRSLTICFAHKVMMIHRAFIGQSFINPAFAVTRMTCIAASKTILHEAKQERLGDGPIIWIDQAFCVAAGIFLCLDIFHRSRDEVEFQAHKGLVEECISMLQQFETSMVAVRGVKLLSSLLNELEGVSGRHLDVSNIVRSVITTSDRATSRVAARQQHPLSPTPTQQASTEDVDGNLASFEDYDWMNSFPTELFPPQAGFSNSFLFNELQVTLDTTT